MLLMEYQDMQRARGVEFYPPGTHRTDMPHKYLHVEDPASEYLSKYASKSAERFLALQTP